MFLSLGGILPNLDDWEMGVRDRDVGIHRVAVNGTLFAHPSSHPPIDPIPLSIHVPSSVTYGFALDDFSQIQSPSCSLLCSLTAKSCFLRLRLRYACMDSLVQIHLYSVEV